MQPTQTPAATAAALAQVAATQTTSTAAPWHDCALAVGWIGCDASAPAIPLRLAVVTANGLVELDLDNPTSWQVSGWKVITAAR